MIDVTHEISSVDRRIGSRTLEAGEGARSRSRACTTRRPRTSGTPARTPSASRAGSSRSRASCAWKAGTSSRATREERSSDAGRRTGSTPRGSTAVRRRGSRSGCAGARRPHGFALEHVAHVARRDLGPVRPGRVGVGWDLGLIGLDLHLARGRAARPRGGRRPGRRRTRAASSSRLSSDAGPRRASPPDRRRRGARGRGAHHRLLHRRARRLIRPARRSPRPRRACRRAARRRRSPTGHGARRRPRAQDQSLKPLITAGVASKPSAQLDEAERLDPAGHAVELPELPLERREHRQPGRAGRLVALLDGHLAADAALEEHPVAVERPVAGHVRQVAVHAHELERQPHAGRRPPSAPGA